MNADNAGYCSWMILVILIILGAYEMSLKVRRQFKDHAYP